jgi:hypothetical protein
VTGTVLFMRSHFYTLLHALTNSSSSSCIFSYLVLKYQKISILFLPTTDSHKITTAVAAFTHRYTQQLARKVENCLNVIAWERDLTLQVAPRSVISSNVHKELTPCMMCEENHARRKNKENCSSFSLFLSRVCLMKFSIKCFSSYNRMIIINEWNVVVLRQQYTNAQFDSDKLSVKCTENIT